MEEEKEIGWIQYKDMSVGEEYFIKEEEEISRIRIQEGTTHTVFIRKFLLNNRNGDLFREYYEMKKNKVYVIEKVILDDEHEEYDD